MSFAASCVGRGCGSHPRAPRAPRGSSGWQSVEQSPATVVVTAIVDDGDLAAYPVTALVERRAGSWQVTRLADD